MSRIAPAKQTFGSAIEAELDEIAKDIRDLVARARDAATDARGLNDLAASFNGLASTLEHAATQVEDTRTEARTWLGVGREPIYEHVSATALQREVAA